MDSAVWQRLLALESRDIVSQWFEKIHGRQLNARRAKEIVASARQGREFFRSASTASFAVRPLLAFYGVASLSRAVALLHRSDAGEEGMTRGHGLETVAWPDTLSGDLSVALGSVGALKVRTCRGLFSDLLTDTDNRMPMHTNSSAVDWGINYPVPEPGREILLSDILDRLPDLQMQRREIGIGPRYTNVNELTYSSAAGAALKVQAKDYESFGGEFVKAGFAVTRDKSLVSLKIDAVGFVKHLPQFLHTYVHKMFGTIPTLHIASEFETGVRYSQIAVTYVLAYFLGMLARYYPTHWTALMSGEKGDAIWPSVNAAQKYVEVAFPELALELIDEALRRPENETTA